MEYPGTIFTRSLRKIFLVIFIIVFFVLAPYLILYTAGYRYDWKNGFFKETGSISIDIEPKQTSVYLNGIKIKDKLPLRLNNIAPAKYGLRLTAPGYYDWTKEIEVKNKETTYIKEISLLKKEKAKQIAGGPIKNLALSPNGAYIIYSKESKGGSEIWLYNTGEKSNIFVAKTKFNALDFKWDNKNLVSITDDSVPHRFAAVLDSQNPFTLRDITRIAENSSKMVWDNPSSPKLYSGSNSGIIAYQPDNGESQLFTKKNYLDWYVKDGQLWTLTTDTSTDGYELNQDVLGFAGIFSKLEELPKDSSILDINNGVVLLYSPSLSQMTLVTKDNQYKISGNNYLISKYNDWWLIWTSWELWTYIKGEEPYLLNRSGETLNQVMPLDKYNTLGLIWSQKATALFPYYLVSHELLSLNIKKAGVDSENKILYYTAGNGDLWSLQY